MYPLHQTSFLSSLYMTVVGTPSRAQYHTVVPSHDTGGVLPLASRAAARLNI